MVNYQFDGDLPSASIFVRDCFCAAHGPSNLDSGSGEAPNFETISALIQPDVPMPAESPFYLINASATAAVHWEHDTVAIPESDGVTAEDQDLLSGSNGGTSISPPLVAPPADARQSETRPKPETRFAGKALSRSLELDAALSGVNDFVGIANSRNSPQASPVHAFASLLDDEHIGRECIQVQGADFDVAEGSNFNRTVACFSTQSGTQSPARFSARIDWGDSSISQGTLIRDGSQFRIAGDHIYARFGSYPVKVQIHAEGRQIAEAASTAMVHDANLQAFGHYGRAVAGREFAGTLAHFRDQNRFGQIGDFSASIHWADGTNSEGIIEANLDGGYDVFGKHIYQNVGNFPAIVTITSAGGNSTTAHASIRVDAIKIVPRGLNAIAIVGLDSKLIVAEFHDADRRATAMIYTAEIDWSDGTSSAGLVESQISGKFVVTGSHRYTRPGLFSVRVSISDSSNHSVATTATIHAIS